MEIIAQLEERFDKLLTKIKELEEENQLLKNELETERSRKQEVQSRIESLLRRLEGGSF